MKVKELKSYLDRFDPDLEVFGYFDDDDENRKNLFVFLIEEVAIASAERVRDCNGRAQLRLKRSERSHDQILLGMISDF